LTLESPLSPRRFPTLSLVLAAGMAHAAARAQDGPPPAPPPAPAPTPPPASPSPADEFEGRAIREIRIVRPVEGKPGETQPVGPAVEQLVRNQLRSKEGLPFERAKVSEDIGLLTRVGRFRTITSQVQPLQDGTVVLIYTVQEQPIIEDVQVIGNREITDQDLLAAVGVLAGTSVDAFQIDRSARAIEDLYLSKGFYRARVEVDQKELEESSIVVFRVIEGERVRVMGVRFRGNAAFTARELDSAVRTTEYIPIFEQGPVDADVLAEDAASLTRFYNDRGYLDARVAHEVRESPDGREAIVTFEVDEGPLYTLRTVDVLYRTQEAISRYKAEVLQDPRAQVDYLTPEQMKQLGYKPLSREQVLGVMAMKPGDVYSEDKLRRSLEAIREAYSKLGAVRDTARGPLSVSSEPRTVRDEQRPLVDLILFLDPGTPYKVGEIIVTGNEQTKQEVVLHEMEIRPGRPLDLAQVDRSRLNLEQRRLFTPQSVRITPLAPQEGSEYRDVNVEVQETNTGSVNLGASVSSDASVVGRFSITQRNFDIADVPDSWSEFFSGRAFRGAGQTASIDIMPGSEVQTYSFSLSDPTLLDSDYSGSGSVFYRIHELRQYEEERYGARSAIGRRFGRIWTGNLTFRNEWVDLRDIDTDAPVDVYDVQDLHRIGAAGIEFTRNTADSNTRPTRGTRTTLSVEQVGALGGDFNFTKLQGEHTAFFTLYESFLGYKTILKLNGQFGYIPQGQDDAPIYERYYLGGQSFRGFAFRGVSPRGIRNDTGERGRDPVGGAWMFFAGAEVQQPVYRDTVSIVGFVDTGTVDTDVGFEAYRVSVGAGVRLFIPGLSPVPLAFDFGFPVLKEPGDRERLFTFSVDLPF
jgi:outer membrane protein insertion porin family